MGSCHRLGLARPAEPPGYTGDGRKERGRGFEDWDDRAFSEAVRVTDYDAVVLGERHPTG